MASDERSGEELPEPHHVGEAYSVRNPLPTVERFIARKDKEAKASASQPLTADSRKSETAAGEASEIIADVPIGDEKTNVLFSPPPDIDLHKVFKLMDERTMHVCFVVAAVVFLLDWYLVGGAIKGFFKAAFAAASVSFALFLVLDSITKQAGKIATRKAKPNVERVKYVPESVEWMNMLVQTVWSAISEEYFAQVRTQIEEQIKAVIPISLIHVSIPVINQGKNAVRVLSIRSLPDSEFEELIPSHGVDKSVSSEEKQRLEKAAEEEEGGTFYNLEVAMAYHAPPMAPRRDKMHFNIVVLLGALPLPIFVETKEFVFHARVRLQMHPGIPFLKILTFALNEVPKIHASVALGFSGAMNLLNFPILDSFIQKQILAASKDFVKPKSMSVDMTPFVGGDDVKRETDAIGILVMKIHKADNLARQDRRGPGADPYLTISFSKYEKPMYATRIIEGDLNPVWEEEAVVLVNVDHVKRQENILLRLWDSDKGSPDDVAGNIEFSLQELILKPKKMIKREDQLHSIAGGEAQGVLSWEVGYFPRASFPSKDGIDAIQILTNLKPNSDLRSGVLSLTIHQCVNINLPMMNQNNDPTQDDSKENEDDPDVEEDMGYLPSVYCTVDVNDQLFYRTRTKSITTAPIYNSTLEIFIRDWETAVLAFAARDVQRKGRDTLIGFCRLPLRDLLTNSSIVTKWLPLDGGSGSGRIKVTALFRSMEVILEKNFTGWNVGRFSLSRISSTSGATKVVIKSDGQTKTLTATDGSFNMESQLSLAVFHRHLSPIIFEVSSSTQSTFGTAVLWLSTVKDNESGEHVLPIWKTDNVSRLVQNRITEGDEHMSLERVGEISVTAIFQPGLSDDFSGLAENADEEDTFEIYQAM